MKLIAIVAHDQNLLIGNHGALPWHLPEDFANFKACTMGHPVIMGGATFLSIGRPLPNRRNMVLSRTLEPRAGIEIFASIPDCLTALRDVDGNVFVLGGSNVYGQFLDAGLLDELWVSEVPGTYEGDAYFPEYRDRFEKYETQPFNTFDFIKYARRK